MLCYAILEYPNFNRCVSGRILVQSLRYFHYILFDSVKSVLELVRLSLIKIHINFNMWNVSMYSVLHKPSRLYISFPMSLYYQNTRTRSGNFPNYFFVASGIALHVTDPRL